MSKLKFTIEFVNQVTGERRGVVVDLADLSARELNEAWRGPGRFTGPVAQAFAFRHAAKQMSSDFTGLPESVRSHLVN